MITPTSWRFLPIMCNTMCMSFDRNVVLSTSKKVLGNVTSFYPTRSKQYYTRIEWLDSSAAMNSLFMLVNMLLTRGHCQRESPKDSFKDEERNDIILLNPLQINIVIVETCVSSKIFVIVLQTIRNSHHQQKRYRTQFS